MIPLLAFGIVTMLGIAALSVDVGLWRTQQRLEQSAADAAAVAGAIRLYYPVTAGTPAPIEVKTAAQAAASDNGYTDDNGVGTTIVSVNEPPANNTPPNVGATPYASGSAVEVVVSKKQPTYFAAIFGRTTQMVSARAVAARNVDPGSNCLTQISPSSGLAFTSGNVDAINCAIGLDGTAKVPGGISATSITYHGSPPVGPTTNNGVSITPIYSATSIADPCPKISGCAYLANAPIPSSSGATDVSNLSTISAPPPPGYAVITKCCAKTVNFQPGIYYIYGGISGAITGTGVTLVNVDGAMTIAANASVNVSAPASFAASPTAGVVFYQPPTNANPIAAKGSSTWLGLFYAPSATVTSNGKGDTFSEIVLGGYGLKGNKTLTIDPNLVPTSGVTSTQLPTHVTLTE